MQPSPPLLITHTLSVCLSSVCHLAAFKVTLPPQGGDEKLDASAFVDLESTFASEPSLTYCTVYSTALFLDRLGSLTQAQEPSRQEDVFRSRVFFVLNAKGG